MEKDEANYVLGVHTHLTGKHHNAFTMRASVPADFIITFSLKPLTSIHICNDSDHFQNVCPSVLPLPLVATCVVKLFTKVPSFSMHSQFSCIESFSDLFGSRTSLAGIESVVPGDEHLSHSLCAGLCLHIIIALPSCSRLIFLSTKHHTAVQALTVPSSLYVGQRGP